MDLGTALDLYCERTTSGWLGEPLNALSNLAFFYGAWRLWSESAGESPASRLVLRSLAINIVLVGAGSLAFHTFATAWARILDLAFIGIFNIAFLIFFLKRVAQWPGYGVLLAVTAFLAADRLTALSGVATLLNGSGTYLPAIAALLALTGYALRICPEAGRLMGRAAAVLLVSLAARTVDQAVCETWRWGTHFLWHLLNAWVLYQLSRSIQLGGARR